MSNFELEYYWREQFVSRLEGCNPNYNSLEEYFEDFAKIFFDGKANFDLNNFILNHSFEKNFDTDFFKSNFWDFIDEIQTYFTDKDFDNGNKFLKIFGVNLDRNNFEELIIYLDLKKELKNEFYSVFFLRISFLIQDLYEIVLNSINNFIQNKTITKITKDPFDDNNGNLFYLVTIKTGDFDYFFLNYDYYFKLGKFAFQKGFFNMSHLLIKKAFEKHITKNNFNYSEIIQILSYTSILVDEKEVFDSIFDKYQISKELDYYTILTLKYIEVKDWENCKKSIEKINTYRLENRSLHLYGNFYTTVILKYYIVVNDIENAMFLLDKNYRNGFNYSTYLVLKKTLINIELPILFNLLSSIGRDKVYFNIVLDIAELRNMFSFTNFKFFLKSDTEFEYRYSYFFKRCLYFYKEKRLR